MESVFPLGLAISRLISAEVARTGYASGMFAGRVFFLAVTVLLMTACGTDVDSVKLEPSQEDPQGTVNSTRENLPSKEELLANQQGEVPSSDPDQSGTVLVEDFDPAKHSRIWMQVLREEDNSPVVGCTVFLHWSREGQFAVGRIRSETDEKGLARFPVEARLFVQSLKVIGTADTAPTFHTIADVIQAGDHDPVVLRVKRPAVFKGRVIDEEGESVPGASISVWSAKRWDIESLTGKEPDVTGTADQDGYFGVGGMSGGRFVLSASADGMVAVQRATGMNGYGETIESIEIIMAPSNMIEGDVLDGDNKGIGGALLEVGVAKRRVNHTPTKDPRLIYIPPRQWLVQTEVDGGFVIPAVPVGGIWNVRIRHSDFLDTFSKMESDLKVARFYMERGLELHLKVTDTEGKPIPSGSARLMGKSRRSEKVLGGNAILKGLLEDPDAILMVHSRGKAAKTIWPVEFNTAEQPLEIMLEPANPIVGKVIDGDGNPITKVRLHAKGLDLFEADLMASYPGNNPEEVFDFADRVSDEDGEFRIPGLYPGRFELKATAPDGREWIQEVQAGTLDLVILFE